MSKFPPNIDGLSFDETLLALVPGIAAVIIARRLSKRAGRGGPHPGIAPSAPADRGHSSAKREMAQRLFARPAAPWHRCCRLPVYQHLAAGSPLIGGLFGTVSVGHRSSA